MKVLVVAEARAGALKPITFELLTAARQLADGGEIAAVAVGQGLGESVAALGNHGAATVYLCDDAAVASPSWEHICKLVCQAMDACTPDAVLFPATMAGKNIAAAVAAARDLGLATDVTELTTEGGEIRARRPIFAGKVLATVTSTTQPFLASVRPGACTATENGGSAAVENLPPVTEGLRVQITDVQRARSARPDVAEADVIISGGRAMASAEKFALLEELADAIGGNCGVGASRAAVDAGFRPHTDQVGQTGKTVAPGLYIAAGISGAIQHLAGMSSSKVIVAINKDAEAPIFEIADYGIVGDLFEVIPALTEAIKALPR